MPNHDELNDDGEWRPEGGEKSAADRTNLAEDRTIMAVERTFAGWMRTAFAAIGIGLAFRALFDAMEPSWLPKVIATIFILLAPIFAVGAERRACRALARMSSHAIDTPDLPRLKWIAYAVSGSAIVLAVAIWWLTYTGGSMTPGR